jgi:excisionase family DNA binding protein
MNALPVPVEDELELLTPQDVSKLLNVPVSWVRQQTRARAKHPIPHMKLGRYVRFQEHAVREWLAQQKRTIKIVKGR